MSPASLFEAVMDWSKTSYGQHMFFVERDLVWTIQNRVALEIVERGLPLRVFNDYPILPGNRRSLGTDLALLTCGGAVEVAIKFKYEPSHRRGGIDIWPTKFPVIGWSNVAHDMARAKKFVGLG